MPKLATSAVACLAVLTIGAANPPPRPPITGISHIAVYAADPAASEDFYARIMGAEKRPNPENAAGARYHFSPQQYVEVLPLPAGQGTSRLAHTAYNTTDAAALRRYLLAKGVAGVSEIAREPDGALRFSARDPEGTEVQFVQPARADRTPAAKAISGRMIHVGYMVKDRAAQDRFYRDVLGFRPYWHGAMREGHTDWVSQQVPDGRDWMEYMMVGEGSTVSPDRVDARQLGVLNHFSLGVPNMQAAVTRMIAEERLSPRRDGPQMGRDGKWQANFYDPDGTRVELMEFQPSTKPCCSEFTAESPTE